MSEEFRESPFPEFKRSGAAPWGEIQEMARRMPGEPGLLDTVLEQFDHLIDVGPWEEMDCEFIYVCAALALAATKFSPEQRSAVLKSMRRGAEELEGCGDLGEDALNSALASFNEPGYVEASSVQEWVEHYNNSFELWCKSMEEEMDLFGQGDGEGIFGDDDEEDDEDDEGEEDAEDAEGAEGEEDK